MKKKVGRPSLYKEHYCQMLIEHMASGYSFETFGAVVDVNRDTLYEWASVHKEFSDAKGKAVLKCQYFWEGLGIKGVWSSKESSLNTGVFCFNMKHRFGWRDDSQEKEKKPRPKKSTYKLIAGGKK